MNKNTPSFSEIRNFFDKAREQKGAKQVKVAASWWDSFREVILDEIHRNGKCVLPGIGYFIVETKSLKVINSTCKGKKVKVRQPESDIPIFVFFDDFIDDVNFLGVSNSFNRRLRNKTLNKQDYLRQKRIEEKGTYGTISPEREAQKLEAFRERLEEKKKENQEENGKN